MVLADDAAAGFAALLARHAGIVRKIAATYCRDRDDRADLAQEIATALWQAFPRYDASRPFSTWMYRVAFNVAISHVRDASRRNRHSVPFDDALHDVAAPPVDDEAGQHAALLQRAIASLDPLNRALLVLYLDDHSHREIAEILGITETNVGTRVARLKERIRRELA
ncbi:MAG: sigma-70 family RNA polymerase sigma factor [Betaproteobacteria bacterium]